MVGTAPRETRNPSKAAAVPSEQQVENHKEKNQAETAAAVVADTGTHVETAAPEEQQKKHKNKDQWHARESSTADRARGSTSLQGLPARCD